MQTFEFTLVVSGIDPGEEGFEDRLYEAGCDDALVSVVKGSLVLDFAREAKNLTHALVSAIQDIQAAGGQVVRVEPDTYVSVSDIAERTGLTRQAVSLMVQGKRGPGDFPLPAIRVSSESPLWDWLEVGRWLRKHGRVRGSTVIVQAALTREINLFLESRRGQLATAGILGRALSVKSRQGPDRRIGNAD